MRASGPARARAPSRERRPEPSRTLCPSLHPRGVKVVASFRGAESSELLRRVLAKLKEIGTFITKCGCGNDVQPFAVDVCWPGKF